MVWVSNQASLNASVSITGSGATGAFIVPPNIKEHAAVNRWFRNGQQTAAITLGDKKFNLAVGPLDFVVIYDDTLITIPSTVQIGF